MNNKTTISGAVLLAAVASAAVHMNVGEQATITKSDDAVTLTTPDNTKTTFYVNDLLAAAASSTVPVQPQYAADSLCWIYSPFDLQDGEFLDVEALTVHQGVPMWVDAVETKTPGHFVMTGPAANYAVKITKFSPTTGITKRRFATRIVRQGPPSPPPKPDDPPEPEPDPDPEPEPDPVDPVLPDGQYKFAAKAYSWAKLVDASTRVKVIKRNDPDGVLVSRSIAHHLAANMKYIADGCVAKKAGDGHTIPAKFISLQDAMNELRGLNRQVLSDRQDLDAWRPWFVAWKEETDRLNASGQLEKSTKAYAVVLNEGATGLQAVK